MVIDCGPKLPMGRVSNSVTGLREPSAVMPEYNGTVYLKWHGNSFVVISHSSLQQLCITSSEMAPVLELMILKVRTLVTDMWCSTGWLIKIRIAQRSARH